MVAVVAMVAMVTVGAIVGEGELKPSHEKPGKRDIGTLGL
jgi:hypothetical protein